jgi:hypothetical protein
MLSNPVASTTACVAGNAPPIPEREAQEEREVGPSNPPLPQPYRYFTVYLEIPRQGVVKIRNSNVQTIQDLDRFEPQVM